jgi:hypothetical protein
MGEQTRGYYGRHWPFGNVLLHNVEKGTELWGDWLPVIRHWLDKVTAMVDKETRHQVCGSAQRVMSLIVNLASNMALAVLQRRHV